MIRRTLGRLSWGRDGGHGRGSIPAHRLRGTPGMAGEPAGTVRTGCSVPAYPYCRNHESVLS